MDRSAEEQDVVNGEFINADVEVDASTHESTVPCLDISGIAGSGKTYMIRKKIEEDPTWGLLCATTGVAAINLGTTTINSALGYFNTDSLRDRYLTGGLSRRLHQIGQEFRWLAVDERSMLGSIQLDLLYKAVKETNAYKDMRDRPLGIALVGDFAQLPPVEEDFCFKADCWPEFKRNTTQLTKVWRQEQAHFLEALNAARRGDGHAAAEILTAWGTTWHTSRVVDFDGTTLVPKNTLVDSHNGEALKNIKGDTFLLRSERWGTPQKEWERVPSTDPYKIGAYVMLLANSKDGDGAFEFVNGDCGHIENYEPGLNTVQVKLVRNGKTVEVSRLLRSNIVKDKPYGVGVTERCAEGYHPRIHRNKLGHFVIGQIQYYPMRLAYASTVHKSQGLSLDRLQVDIRDHFFSSYGMIYVALSRCRTQEGLRIVGSVDKFIKQCQADPRVAEWL